MKLKFIIGILFLTAQAGYNWARPVSAQYIETNPHRMSAEQKRAIEDSLTEYIMGPVDDTNKYEYELIIKTRNRVLVQACPQFEKKETTNQAELAVKMYVLQSYCGWD